MTEEVLEQARRKGVRITSEVSHSTCTLKCYDFFATTMDPNISRVSADSARKKSMGRRIASQWATQVCCNTVSQYVPGHCTIPDDLTDGCDKRTLVGHVKGSKQTTRNDEWSVFYSYYPDQSSTSLINSLRRGRVVFGYRIFPWNHIF